MSDYLDPLEAARFQAHGLGDFEALWAIPLEPVDAPNLERGGQSWVYRLQLGDAAYYLKRQVNHLSRSWRHPFGEPTFAREFRAIRRYRALGVPALSAVFYGERRAAGEHRAILVTRALDGWSDLSSWLARWPSLAAPTRQAILGAVGDLVRRLHAQGQVHGCLYPKHLFLRERAPDAFEACLIDLEKSRTLLLGRRDRLRDLDTLVRRGRGWTVDDVRQLLHGYLGGERGLEGWLARLTRRRLDKERRA